MIKGNKSAENKTKNKLRDSNDFSKHPNIKKKPLKESSLEEQTLKIYTIKKLHSLALEKYNKLKKIKDINYKIILDEILNKLYDLDEEINEFFLMRLRQYYIENKKEIDNGDKGESDNIASLFFKYIFTLSSEKRKRINVLYNFFKENELFFKSDMKYFREESFENVFKIFIKNVMEIAKTTESDSPKISEEEYRDRLGKLYENYEFPEASYKIPTKYGNKELIYINFILQFKTILCIQNKGYYEDKFFRFNLAMRLLALTFFKEYFDKKEYDILSVQYIIFSINSLFIYCDVEVDFIEDNIKKKMFACSRFLYQSFKEKKFYIKQIKEYIKNKINIETIDENYLKNNLLIINYNNKETKIDGYNCYFLGNIPSYLDDLSNDNVYSFEYLRSLNFPLFVDKNLNNDFNDYVKLILQSNLMTQYINSLKNIPRYQETIFTDEILEEIRNNTIWVKFPVNSLHGLSDRNTYTIYLNNSFDIQNRNKFSCNLSSKIVTNVHEDSNHILRLILNINNYDIPKTTPKNGITIYNNYWYNEQTAKYEDQGDKWEKIIFGEKLTNIFIMGSLIILDSNNFNLKINEFKKKFSKNNKIISIDLINTNLISLKENKKNKLAKYINEFNEEKSSNDYWLQNEQSVVARNKTIANFTNGQCINFGICGTHGLVSNLFV